MIIDSDYNTLTIKDNNNKLLIRNINEYNLMKYNEFDGKRITYELFNCKIEETFNDGIFNIQVGNTKLQSHDKIEVCKRIGFCKLNNSIDPIVDLLKDSLQKEINKEFFTNVLKPFGNRVKLDDSDESIIIDDVYKVDKNGQAYYKNINGQYCHVCIVAGSPRFKHMISHILGKIQVEFRTLEIYYKVLFLLYPDKSDKVFYRQIPKYLKERI